MTKLIKQIKITNNDKTNKIAKQGKALKELNEILGNVERLLKNINFVESILSFISSKDYTENNKDFKSFVNKSRKYKYLKEFIKYLNEH